MTYVYAPEVLLELVANRGISFIVLYLQEELSDPFPARWNCKKMENGEGIRRKAMWQERFPHI